MWIIGLDKGKIVNLEDIESFDLDRYYINGNKERIELIAHYKPNRTNDIVKLAIYENFKQAQEKFATFAAALAANHNIYYF